MPLCHSPDVATLFEWASAHRVQTIATSLLVCFSTKSSAGRAIHVERDKLLCEFYSPAASFVAAFLFLQILQTITFCSFFAGTA